MDGTPDHEQVHTAVKMRDVTFIATYAGREPDLGVLLESLLRQTSLPREVVLVDGGPAGRVHGDVTAFTEEARRRGIRVIVLERPGCRIAAGRNSATGRAVHDIVASSDAGCILEEDWLRAITAPFENPEVDAVAGTYRPVPGSLWEKASAAFLMPDPDRTARRLPSARSLAYRKRAWKAVEGFPEELAHGEDTVFALRMQDAGLRIEFAGDALVRWRPRPGPVSFFRQIFRYSAGDGTAGVMRGYYLKKITMFTVLVFLLLLVPVVPLLAVLPGACAAAAFAVLARRVPPELGGAGVHLLLLPVFLLHLLAQVTGFLYGAAKREGSGTAGKPDAERNW